MLTAACTTAEKITINAFPVTATGKPAAFDGPIEVTVVDGDGTVEPATAENPNSFKIVSGDVAGKTTYRARADVDRGEGVKHIEEMIELTVGFEEAAGFGFSIGNVEPK